MNRKELTPTTIRKLYEEWDWNPGTLLQLKIDRYYFWIFDNCTADVLPMNDENDCEKDNEIIIGEKTLAIYKGECVLFLGCSPIDIAKNEERKPACDNYYVLKFLTNSCVVYLDIFPIVHSKRPVSDIFAVHKEV